MEDTKKCSRCKEVKNLNLFHKNNGNKNGYANACKECISLYHKLNYYPKNKNKILKQTKKYYQENLEYFENYQKEWKGKNREKIQEYQKFYYSLEENKKQHQKNMKNWYENNKKKAKEYAQKNKEKLNNCKNLRYKNNIDFRISSTIRIRIWFALKGKARYNDIEELLGCTIEEYKKYLESLFLPEMNWSNFGEIWEINHIIGCINFNLTQSEEQFKCFNYKNTEPRFSTTAIAESLGYKNYIGNRNLPKK